VFANDVVVTATAVAPAYLGSGLDSMKASQVGNTFFVSTTTGMTLIVTTYGSWLGYRLIPAAAHRGQTRGLCGNWNGNMSDDFTGRDGVVYSTPASFGDTWRVPSSESIFGAELQAACPAVLQPTPPPPTVVNIVPVARVQAQNCCAARGLKGAALTNCLLDVGLIEDGNCQGEFGQQKEIEEDGPCEELDNCNGHGTCVNNACVCAPGWVGNECDESACDECEKNQECVNGVCAGCKPGFDGSNCEFVIVNGSSCECWLVVIGCQEWMI